MAVVLVVVVVVEVVEAVDVEGGNLVTVCPDGLHGDRRSIQTC